MKRIIISISLSLAAYGAVAQEQGVIDQQIEVSETVVNSQRTDVNSMGLPLTISVLSDSLLTFSHQQSLLPQLSEYVPGLFVSQRGVMGYGISTGAAGGIKIRGIGGSPTSQVLVVIDGAPQYMGIMGHPMADSYLASSTERVEVVRGPQSMQYGSGAMGGVINIVTRDVYEDGVQGFADLMYGSYNSLESSAGASYRSGALSASGSLSYSRSDGHRENMDFDQVSGAVKLGYYKSGPWRVEGDLNITEYNASNPGTDVLPINDNDSRVVRGEASVNITNRYDRTSGGVSLYYNFGRHHINEGYYDGESPLEYRFKSRDVMAGVAAYQSYRYVKGGDVTLGIDYRYMGGETKNVYLDGSPETPLLDKDFSELAGYINFKQQITQRLSLNAGVRLDGRFGEQSEWVPSAGVSYTSGESGLFRAVAAKGFRYATIREMYMTAMQNPDLEPESLMSYELSYGQRLCGMQLEATLFYIDGDNIIETTVVDSRPIYSNTFEVKNWGVELSLNGQLWRKLSLMSNYSYLNMKNVVVSAPEHKLYVGLGYGLTRWSFSGGVQYIAGLYSSTAPIEKQDFVLLNASVSFKASDKLSIYLRGENLTDSSYEILDGYIMPGATCFGGVRLQF